MKKGCEDGAFDTCDLACAGNLLYISCRLKICHLNNLYAKYINFTRNTLAIIDRCVNTRDNGGGFKCSTQLGWGSTCVDYLAWGDCDAECGLCACSTAHGTTRQHCSGHGKCEATCEQNGCTDAKCNCNEGWTGDRCEIATGANLI